MNLGKYFQDNMVVQCDEEITVWGNAEPGSEVCVQISKGAVIAREGKIAAGPDGRFILKLRGLSASYTKYDIKAKAAGETAAVRDVLFGDVFLFAGQSNMDYPVWAMSNSEELTNNFEGTEYIRTIKFVTKPLEDGTYVRPFYPQDEIPDNIYWNIPAKDTIESFSGFGYMIAKNMAKKLGKPVGAVDTSMGGMPLCSYLPFSCAKDSRMKNYRNKLEYTEEEYNKAGILNLHQTSGIYNEYIYPLRNAAFKAIVWYQGEAEVMGGFPEAYGDALSVLHDTFENTFGMKLPMFVMNIASCRYYLENGVNMLNIAISKWGKGSGDYFTTQYDIPPFYIGERDFDEYGPIHPSYKEPLADRASEQIYANVYEGKDVNPPVFESYAVSRGRLTVKFRVSSPLASGKIFGLYIIDSEDRAYMLKASVSGPDTVSASVRGHSVKGVSYACFINNSRCDLKDSSGLPAAPFTTEPGFAYTPVIPFFCNSDTVQSCNFLHDHGGNYLKPSWKKAVLFGDEGTKISIKGGIPTVYHVPLRSQYWYFGISPEINQESCPVDLSKYSKITVKLKTSGDTTHFTGIHFRKNGKTHCITKAEGYLCGVNLNKGQNEITLDLNPLDCLNIPEGKDVLENITDIQLTFRDRNKGSVKILGVSLL